MEKMLLRGAEGASLAKDHDNEYELEADADIPILRESGHSPSYCI